MPTITFKYQTSGAKQVAADLQSIASVLQKLQVPAKTAVDLTSLASSARTAATGLGQLSTQQGNAATAAERFAAAARASNDAQLAIARSLGISIGEVQKLSQSFGLNESQLAKVIARYQQLDAAGANTQQKFNALNRELGVGAETYTQLERSITGYKTQAEQAATATQQLAQAEREAAAAAQQQAAEQERLRQTAEATSQLLLQQAAQFSIGVSQDSLNSFAEFDTSIRNTQAVSRASAEDIAVLREEVIRLGIETSKTPQEVADVSTAFTRAGFTALETADALSGVVLASEASGESLATVGDIIAKTTRQFGLQADEAGRVADVLTIAANASNVSVSSLGQSLKFAGTQGAAANQDLETVVTLLGALGDVGLQGGQGGRNLAAALRQLQQVSAASSTEIEGLKTASDNALAAFDALQVSFRDSNGEIRPLLEILPEIRTQLATLSPPDQDAVLQAIFGTEGSRAIVGILNKTDEELAALAGTIYDAEGAAAAASETILGGFGGSLVLLGSSIDTAKLNFGEFLADGVKPLVDGLISLINLYNSAPASIQLVINVTGALAASLVTLTAAAAAYEALQIRSAVLLARDNVLKTANLLVTKGLAIAQGALALSTQSASAATATLAGKLSVLAAVGASVAIVKTVFDDIASASEGARQAIEDNNAVLAELAKLQRELATGAQEQSDATANLIDQNLQNFEESRSRITQIRDAIVEAINAFNPGTEQGGFGDLVTSETAAIREQARSLSDFGDEVDAAFAKIQGIDPTTLDPQLLELYNKQLDQLQANAESIAPLNEANDSTLQSFNRSIDAARNLLNGTTNAIDEETAALQTNEQALASSAQATAALLERRRELQGRQDQTTFDRGEFEIQLEQDAIRREEERAFQASQQQQQAAFDETQRQLEQQLQTQQEQKTAAFNESQRRAEETFNTQQEQRRREFEQEIANFREQRQSEIDQVQQQIDREVQLAQADSAQARADLQRQFAEQDAEAQLRAQLEAESGINELRQQLEDEVQRRQDEFNKSQQEAERLFQVEQQAQQTAFQATLDAQKLALEEQIAERKRQLEAELQAQQDAFQEAQARRDFDLQQEAQARQAAFNDQQRLLDEQNAVRIKEILESVQIQSPSVNTNGDTLDIPAFREGGIISAGAIARVHGDELLMRATQPTTVISQKASRELASHGLMPIAMRSASPITPVASANPMVAIARRMDSRLATIENQLRASELGNKTQYNTFIERAPTTLDLMRAMRW
jgi:TP901 family phage tail tape measure protein